MNRRQFLRSAIYGTATVGTLGSVCYGFAESNDLVVDRRTVRLPRLPAGFAGLRVAFVTDVHHGPFVSQDYLTAVVRTATLLEPDLIVLGGDYTHRDGKFIAPCFDVLAGLRAPLGVYGVLGEHDYRNGADETRAAMNRAGVIELTNRGVWLAQSGDRMRLAGVDDLWTGTPDVSAALGDCGPSDACLLVSHNPDLAEALTDRRVGLVLSGHTHGGQVVIPRYGAPWTPSRYGMKYAHGLVEAPAARVYVSAGVGMTGLPVRGNCKPEVSLLTLTAGT